MSRRRYLGLLAVAFAGCFGGTYLARLHPDSAHAQVPPGRQRIPGVVNQDVLFVPTGGLRMVTEQNRTIGVLFEQGGSGGLVLFDGGGQPSVLLQAGPGGKLDVNLTAEATLRLGRQGERTAVRLQVTDAQSTVRLGQSFTATTGPDGGRLTLSDARNTSTARLDGTPDGGRLTMYDRAGQAVFATAVGKDGASLEVRDAKGELGFRAAPGRLTVQSGEEVLFAVPKAP